MTQAEFFILLGFVLLVLAKVEIGQEDVVAVASSLFMSTLAFGAALFLLITT